MPRQSQRIPYAWTALILLATTVYFGRVLVSETPPFILPSKVSAHQVDRSSSSPASCSHQGRLFFGSCICHRGFTGSECELETDELQYTATHGVISVSKARWERAQAAESDHWKTSKDSNDGWDHHARRFGNYSRLEGTYFKRWLEIGCGPFTQTLNILRLRPDITTDLVTLSDPNIFKYVRQVSECTYTSGMLGEFQTRLVDVASEELLRSSSERFDVVVAINVAEHVRDILRHFETLYELLKPNGQLIFSDRAWDTYEPVEHFRKNPKDVLFHPTRAKTPVFEIFLSQFEPNLCVQTRTPDELNPTAFYFIGRKRNALEQRNFSCTVMDWNGI